MSELALRMGVTRGAVTQIISRMEDKDFVRRSKQMSDARSTNVSLAPKGILAYTVHYEMHESFCRKFHEQLSPQEIEIFKVCIDKFCNILRE